MRVLPWRRPRRRGAPPCVGCAEARAARMAEQRHTIEAEVAASPTAVPRRRGNERNAVIEEQLVLLDAETGRFHVLSTSAALVYTSIDGESTVAAIAATLAAEFGSPGAEVEADVRSAIGSLMLEGLVVLDDAIAEESTAAGVVERPATAPARWDGARLRRLDAGEWPDAIGPFVAGAAVVLVRFAEPDIRRRLAETIALLPPAATDAVVDCTISVTGRVGRGPFRVFLDGEQMHRSTDLALTAETVLGVCNQAAASHPTDVLRMHGGVVAREGRAVVICGESGRGKSSLTTALVQAGWGYVTDEVAIIDPEDRSLVPYPKWIDLNSDSVKMLGIDAAIGLGDDAFEHHLPPTALGSVVSGRPQLAAIIVLGPTPGDGEAAGTTPIIGVDALIELLRHVFAGTWDDNEALQHLADICVELPVVKLGRAEPAEMVAEVVALLGRHP